ncbi:unnamed protein product [Effrenium voratum]|uniref:Uncharacterized protein n=1 Tax=Effrenium voratum TaxID=2562239 RepID=A0AA36MZI0_9DINO|nr:unnamed protein product [Effrenium voratum]CAJ1432027.1 unnamed protein product [Effrenium voratum]
MQAVGGAMRLGSESDSEPGLCDCLVERSPRLLQRGMPRSRTRAAFRIKHCGLSGCEQFVRSDVFHYMANMPLRWLLPIYTLFYLFGWVVFAFWWQLAADGCEPKKLTFRRSFMLSLETMTTIGYGVADPFFDDCPEVIPLLIVQSLVGLLMDAIFLNLIYTRFSTAFTRASSIIFSDKIIAYSEDGFVKICFRICEVAKRPLIEPLVRMYALKHATDALDNTEVDVVQMRLEQPCGDIADGKLFLSLPAKVIHRVNTESPLSQATDVGSLENFLDCLQSLDFVEVIAIVSGTCPITGSSLEARQSYTLSDIQYDCAFAPCVAIRDGTHRVDFTRFHETVPDIKFALIGLRCAEAIPAAVGMRVWQWSRLQQRPNLRNQQKDGHKRIQHSLLFLAGNILQADGE